ncbi:MAG: YhdP family protein [Betaproteobacteria bacterium]
MDRAELRAALARRLRWLWRALAVPGVRRGVRWAGILGLALYFVFIALVLVLRYAVLPQVASHQAEIEQYASRTIGLPVTIERIEASWEGINPRLVLTGVHLADRQGKPALAFERVEGVLSWHTVWRFKPILALFAIDGPVLHVRRNPMGRITVAGFEAEDGGEADPRLMQWFFDQRRIRIRDATIVWDDAKRQAPQLVLEALQFGLDNRGSRHFFGITAVPPAHLAARLDIRGDVRGDPTAGIEALSGSVFAELDYADLAGWRAWVDYPVRMQQGRGAVRAWGEWNKDRGSATADVALEDVRVHLGKEVPQLALASMRGRILGEYRPDAWKFAGKKLELSTADGIRVPPTDFHLEWRRFKDGNFSGSATANYIDLGALERLAGYLPLDARSRELLNIHQPRGRISDLSAGWETEGDLRLKHYSLQARFDRLGMRPAGYFPGGEGLTGEVQASEKSGSLVLDSKNASLDLPAVFPESKVPLASLKAKANWKIDGKLIDTRLERVEFASPDAAGTAHGTYRFAGDGPGVIDLAAELSRADARAVWRYMPKVINPDVSSWLKRGLVSGSASDAKLALRGDLKDFPFADKQKGEFLITAKAKDVRIDYAPGWPVIDGVDADMSFGAGMRIQASKGSIFGARIGPVTAEIPLFDAHDGEMLIVSGQAEGPTAEFLRFIDKSPVGEKINRMTDEMRAVGAGKLVLRLDMPLMHIDDSRVQGEYEFLDNQVTAVAGLPPITQVKGRIAFTEKTVSAREITGNVLGAPMRLAIRDEKAGVVVAMSGGAVARDLRKAIDSPAFDYLSGSTTWKGEVRVHKKTTDFVIESNLVGISSSLPEPFNKSATVALPLHFEKASLASADKTGRDQVKIALGSIAQATLVRREDGGAMHLERGAVGIGGPLPAMPAQGVAIAANVAKLDGDFWRRLTPTAAPAVAPGTAQGGGKAGGAIPVSTQIALKTPLLRLFGRDFNDVNLNAGGRDGGWQIAVNAREAVGDLFWHAGGNGNVRADMKRLVVPAEEPAAASGDNGNGAGSDGVGELMDKLPGLDVRVADFAIGTKRLGRLEAKAHNERGAWHLDNLLLQNPDGSLKGTGVWRSRGGHRTHLDFELVANDIGKLLERLGYAGAVRRGTATLKGDLAWDGPLTNIHYPSLSGTFNVLAQKGQFAKLEPGIGKLLGLISLQSIPRRLSLDFRDIFTEGMAFDSIEAKLAVNKGIMRTVDDLKINGPAARILMKGEADLKQETQNLTVTVQPEVGGLAAVGAVALAHPVVGAAAFVANKILQNPLDRMFAFQYKVTGTWADPKVEKLNQATPAPAGSETALPGNKP